MIGSFGGRRIGETTRYAERTHPGLFVIVCAGKAVLPSDC